MGLNGDRRQDVGLKLVYSLLTGIIAMMLTVFLMKTFSTAEEARAGVADAKRDIAVLQQCIKGIDVSLVKMDIKLDKILDGK